MKIFFIFVDVCKFIGNLILPVEEIDFELKKEYLHTKKLNDLAYSVLSYKHEEVKKLIHAFKYDKAKKALGICSKLLLENILEVTKIMDLKYSILVPVPRAKFRHKKFGFDQCVLLCEEILKNPEIQKLNLQFESEILIHKKEFDSQTKSTRAERIKNSKNTFFVKNSEKIPKQKIILIDDVWTTGSTLLDAKRALFQAGFREIFCFTIAH